MSEKNQQWIEQPLRILDLIFTPRLDDYPIEEAIAMCKRMHANVIHFHCQYNMRGGFADNEMYFKRVNGVMPAAKATSTNPRTLAEAVVGHLQISDIAEPVEVAGIRHNHVRDCT